LLIEGESIESEANSADGVLVAQAFHWMATQTTLKEIHRVLKRNKPLILIW
jgi:ubiquinone/menaquinone biosynthesis C-methylase UbiE